jgi:transcriptional regulator with XRE-family HTH domain
VSGALGQHPGDLGRRVRHRREELGLTRAELANRAGLKEAAIGYIEDQPAMQRPEIVLRLA